MRYLLLLLLTACAESMAPSAIATASCVPIARVVHYRIMVVSATCDTTYPGSIIPPPP